MESHWPMPLKVLLIAAVTVVNLRRIEANDAPGDGSRIVSVVSEQYYEMFYEPVSYSSAEDACDESDGFLAALRDQFVVGQIAVHAIDPLQMTQSTPTSSSLHNQQNGSRFFWVGLERKDGGVWRWNDGTRFRDRFFASSTLNEDKDNKKSGGCAGLLLGTAPFDTPVLQRRDCSFKAPYICQYDPKPCTPSAVLSPVSTAAGPYIPCDEAAALQNRREMTNDCSCSAGQVRHVVDQVLCNRQNWYWNAYCVAGCPPPPFPVPLADAVPLTDRPSYWQGNAATFLCVPAAANDPTDYRAVALTCAEGGLWSGYRRGQFCREPDVAPLPVTTVSAVTGSKIVLECGSGLQFDGWWWIRGDARLVPGNRHTVDPRTGQLLIDGARAEDGDAYVCVAVYGNVSSVPWKVYAVIVADDAAAAKTSNAASDADTLDVRLNFTCCVTGLVLLLQLMFCR